ncbi:MAG: DUF4982 domain-containing protein, partial [Verrucomicrobiae bacterium]|nr:DUF4982 domain-containing protein [Verrucomicrobiae bacterium]
SYDNASVRISVRHSWQRTSSFDFLIGEFRWGGFDYLGESNFWPTRFHSFGVIDLCGFPKDHFYLLQSLWSDKPMVHILPHWTHPGKEGVKIPVVAYTNCDEVELRLNGNSLSRQTYKGEQLVWMVPYSTGTIEAVAYKDGKQIAEDSYRTAGDAAKVEISGDRETVLANNRDVIHLEVTIADSHGTLVPKADNLVKFDIAGPARLLGVENGDPLDHALHKVPQRKAFRGKCLLILQSTGEPGTITVTASSDGLEAGKVKILSRQSH